MKLSNLQLVNSIQVLKQLSNQSLPIKVSFYVSKNIKSIQAAAEVFEEEKKKLMKQYCEKKEDGSLNVHEDGTVDILDKEGWNKDFGELLELESEVDVIKISISDFNQTAITPQEVQAVEFMLKE